MSIRRSRPLPMQNENVAFLLTGRRRSDSLLPVAPHWPLFPKACTEPPGLTILLFLLRAPNAATPSWCILQTIMRRSELGALVQQWCSRPACSDSSRHRRDQFDASVWDRRISGTQSRLESQKTCSQIRRIQLRNCWAAQRAEGLGCLDGCWQSPVHA